MLIDDREIKGIIEGLLFVWDPLSLKDIKIYWN